MRNLSHFRGIVLLLILVLMFVSNVSDAQTPQPESNQSKAARISYQDVPLNTVIKSLATQLKLNVVYDESFRDEPKYNIELNDVTLESALKVIFIQKKLAAKRIEEKTIIVFADNPNNRARLAEHPDWPAKQEKK